MRRIAPVKARDAEDEQLAEKSWRAKMKVLSRRPMAPGVLLLLCVVSLLFRMRQEKLKFLSMDLGYSLGVGHESSSTSSAYQNTTQATFDRLHNSTPSLGWRPSAALRSLHWPRSTSSKKQRIPRGAMQWWPQPAAGRNL